MLHLHFLLCAGIRQPVCIYRGFTSGLGTVSSQLQGFRVMPIFILDATRKAPGVVRADKLTITVRQ